MAVRETFRIITVLSNAQAQVARGSDIHDWGTLAAYCGSTSYIGLLCIRRRPDLSFILGDVKFERDTVCRENTCFAVLMLERSLYHTELREMQ